MGFVVLRELCISKHQQTIQFVQSVDESDAASLGTALAFNIMHHEQY